MAFANVLERLNQQFSSRLATQNVNLPAVVAFGELVTIAITGNFLNAGDDPFLVPSGWTLLGQDSRSVSGFTGIVFGVFARRMDGSEGGTSVAFSIDGGEDFTAASTTKRISGVFGTTVADAIEISALSVFSALTTVTVPDLTASWGADDNLFTGLGGAADDNIAWTNPTSPLNPATLTSVDSGAGASNGGCSTGGSDTEDTAATETGGTFNLFPSESGYTARYVVRPGTVAPPVTFNPAWAMLANQ